MFGAQVHHDALKPATTAGFGVQYGLLLITTDS